MSESSYWESPEGHNTQSIDNQQGVLFPELNVADLPHVLPLASQTTPVDEFISQPDTKEFAIALLALSKVTGLGRIGISALCKHFDSELEKVWSTTPDVLFAVLRSAKVPSVESIVDSICNRSSRIHELGKRAVEELNQRNIWIIPSKNLPENLRNIPNPPSWLFVQGNVKALYLKPMVAIVGTRTPTIEGLQATNTVAKIMSAYPITLVSGLAEGIDAEAHYVSITEGLPNIAFLGHGINHIFPKSTAVIRQSIVDLGGAVASEYLPDEHYQKRYFVERNRLQAALADMVIPVEAKARSGTAHTIRFSRQYEKRIIGLRWSQENEFVKLLEHNDAQIIRIFRREGQQLLDHHFQLLTENFLADAYPLKQVEKLLLSEMASRYVQKKDLHRLLQFVVGEMRGKEID